MIVKPQLFSYRLIISALVVVLTVLGVVSFTYYTSSASHEELLEQENTLVASELKEVLVNYDDLNAEYSATKSQMQLAQLETKRTIDSLNLLKSELSVSRNLQNRERSAQALSLIHI